MARGGEVSFAACVEGNKEVHEVELCQGRHVTHTIMSNIMSSRPFLFKTNLQGYVTVLQSIVDETLLFCIP